MGICFSSVLVFGILFRLFSFCCTFLFGLFVIEKRLLVFFSWFYRMKRERVANIHTTFTTTQRKVLRNVMVFSDLSQLKVATVNCLHSDLLQISLSLMSFGFVFLTFQFRCSPNMSMVQSTADHRSKIRIGCHRLLLFINVRGMAIPNMRNQREWHEQL